MTNPEMVGAASPADQLTTMSIDQLIDYKAQLREQAEIYLGKMRDAETVLAEKIKMDTAQKALAAAGVTGVVLSPAPAVIGVEPSQAETGATEAAASG